MRQALCLAAAFGCASCATVRHPVGQADQPDWCENRQDDDNIWACGYGYSALDPKRARRSAETNARIGLTEFVYGRYVEEACRSASSEIDGVARESAECRTSSELEGRLGSVEFMQRSREGLNHWVLARITKADAAVQLERFQRTPDTGSSDPSDWCREEATGSFVEGCGEAPASMGRRNARAAALEKARAQLAAHVLGYERAPDCPDDGERCERVVLAMDELGTLDDVETTTVDGSVRVRARVGQGDADRAKQAATDTFERDKRLRWGLISGGTSAAAALAASVGVALHEGSTIDESRSLGLLDTERSDDRAIWNFMSTGIALFMGLATYQSIKEDFEWWFHAVINGIPAVVGAIAVGLEASNLGPRANPYGPHLAVRLGSTVLVGVVVGTVMKLFGP